MTTPETNEPEDLDGDDVIVAALAQGLGYEDAGGLAGVSGRTVRRRMQDPQFAAAVSRAKSERFAQTVGQLSDLSTAAMETLRDALNSAEPIKVRLHAAGMVLRHLREHHAAAELEARVERVEALADRFENVIDEDEG